MSAYIQTVVGSDSPPVGAVMDFAGNVEPSGWLFCFGQALPRTGIYAQLFDVIGTLYGAGDGSTTFNLPDFRGRVGAGRDDMGGAAASRLTAAWGVNGAVLGANGGAESHQLTVDQMPSHLHGRGAVVGGQVLAAGSNYVVLSGNQNTLAAGGNEAHPNLQPTFIVNKIIKYTVSGTVLPIVPGDGDVVGPASSVDGDLAVFQGTSGKFITGVSRVDAMPVGSIVQVVNVTAGADSTALVIPFDGTSPQITEGKEYLSLPITPIYANSKMLLVMTGTASHSIAAPTAAGIAVALFRSGVSDTLGSTQPVTQGSNQAEPFAMQTDDFPATTDVITYSIRFGASIGSTTVYLGRRGDSATMLGGTMKSCLTVYEIKQ
jgi:microcystin-dependent protein